MQSEAAQPAETHQHNTFWQHRDVKVGRSFRRSWWTFAMVADTIPVRVKIHHGDQRHVKSHHTSFVTVELKRDGSDTIEEVKQKISVSETLVDLCFT